MTSKLENHPPLRIGLAGFGLIGRRRARIAAADSRVQLAGIADPSPVARLEAAALYKVPVDADARKLLRRPLDVLLVAAPNVQAVPIAIAALRRGLHVLMEKPPGANLGQCRPLCSAAETSGRILKFGFNHRYHPAVARLAQAVRAGDIGKIINLRARYGHGGRPGYDQEWRGQARLSGGGELLDQGVHLLDLLHWLLGMPDSVYAELQTAVWPVQPLEDNAFALLHYPGGAVASLHSSWTQWKNLFSLEVFGETGSLIVEGLGGSYGPETLLHHRRRPAGGPPETTSAEFQGPDSSWQLEWEDFMNAMQHRAPYQGAPAEAMAVMQVLDRLRRSARLRRRLPIAVAQAAAAAV